MYYKRYAVETGHRGVLVYAEVHHENEGWAVHTGSDAPGHTMRFDNVADACVYALDVVGDTYNSSSVFGPLMITITDGDRS